MMSSRSPLRKLRSASLLARCVAPTCAAIETLEVRRLLTAWYVSTTGAASNNGTLHQPFATIQEAANVAQPGDTVYIMGGTYHETVTPPNSGTVGAPITFEPYNGQSVTIDGADPVTGWSLDQGSIYSAPQSWDLGEGNNQVFVDGTMVNEARWPNTPADIAGTSSTAPANISTPTWATAASVSVNYTISATSTVTIFNASLNQPAGTWVGSVVHMAAGQGWVDQTGTITASSPGSITVSYYQETSYQVPGAGMRFYIVGNFKALDSAGEWYRDPVSGNLYLWDPAGDSPANHTIEAKARLYGFDLSGLSDIDITNIDLFACTINTDANSANNVLNGISAQYVSQSIGITPDTQDPWGAKFHPHTTGIILNGTGNILENSMIAFSSGDGVFLGGSGNAVENTVIHDVDYEGGDEAGITSIGADETILDDTIYNAARSGIVCRYTYDSLISHNLIYDVALQMTDCGGIYTWGTDGAGTEISYNVIYGVQSGGYGAAGIYLDNGSQDFIVDHNLVFNCDFGLKLNPPSWSNLIVNNTFVGTQYAVDSSGDEDMTGTLLANNIFIGATMFGTNATLTKNITSAASADFTNAAQENYQLLKGSSAINFGIPELPFSGQVVGSAPDAGAYEYGLAPFAAGAAAQSFVPPTPTTPTVSPAPATPPVLWATPAAISYGVALSVAQLDPTSPIPGNFVYAEAPGTILNAGAQTLSATFTPLDTIDYAPVTATVTINVLAATPVLAWANPAAIVYGMALGAAQLDATSSVPGTFSYAPANGTILGAGIAENLSVTFTPTDAVDYTTSTMSAAISVAKATPTIAWPAPSPIVYGTALSAAELDATSSVRGTFVYSPAAGTILNAASSQTLSVAFTPADAVDYAPVTASVAIGVLKATPAVAWANPSDIVYGTSLGAVQLDATSSVSGTFAYSPAHGTVLGAGDGQSLSVTFTPANAADYSAATASVAINVTPATPAIAWANPAAITSGVALSAVQLDATSAVAGTFTYTPAAGAVLGLGNTQPLSVTFTPADAADYSAATASTTIDVVTTIPTITWPNPAAITYGTALSAAQLDATSSVPGTFVYSPAAGAILGAGESQILSVAFTPTDTIDDAAATASVPISVAKATPNITWKSPSSIPYGTPLSGAQFNATASVPGTFTYNYAAGSVLTPGAVALKTTFTPTDSADFTVASAAVTLTINKASTSTALTSNSASPIAGQSLILTATVTPANGGGVTGTVQFQIDGSNVGSPATLVGGVATYTTSSLAAGAHSIAAIYSGDSNFLGSSSVNQSASVAALRTIPAITAQPASQTKAAGTSVTFTSAATGTPAPTVQWQLSTNSGSTWANISGAIAASYTCTTTLSQNGYAFRAVYTNSAGSVATAAATLSVYAPPAKLVFMTQPTTAIAGAILSQVNVEVEDASGNIVSALGSTITLAISSGPAGGKLLGYVIVNTSKGIATFSNLSFKVAGSYTLTATDGTLTAGISKPIAVAPGAAQELAIVQQPTTAVVGTKLTPQIIVDVEDAYGNIVSANASTVTIAPSSTSAPALAGVLAVKAVNGVAIFSDVLIQKAGTLSLTLSDGALTAAVSKSIVVVS